MRRHLESFQRPNNSGSSTNDDSQAKGTRSWVAFILYKSQESFNNSLALWSKTTFAEILKVIPPLVGNNVFPLTALAQVVTVIALSIARFYAATYFNETKRTVDSYLVNERAEHFLDNIHQHLGKYVVLATVQEILSLGISLATRAAEVSLKERAQLGYIRRHYDKEQQIYLRANADMEMSRVQKNVPRDSGVVLRSSSNMITAFTATLCDGSIAFYEITKSRNALSSVSIIGVKTLFAIGNYAISRYLSERYIETCAKAESLRGPIQQMEETDYNNALGIRGMQAEDTTTNRRVESLDNGLFPVERKGALIQITMQHWHPLMKNFGYALDCLLTAYQTSASGVNIGDISRDLKYLADLAEFFNIYGPNNEQISQLKDSLKRLVYYQDFVNKQSKPGANDSMVAWTGGGQTININELHITVYEDQKHETERSGDFASQINIMKEKLTNLSSTEATASAINTTQTAPERIAKKIVDITSSKPVIIPELSEDGKIIRFIITGPFGSGKSSFLAALVGMIPPTSYIDVSGTICFPSTYKQSDILFLHQKLGPPRPATLLELVTYPTPINKVTIKFALDCLETAYNFIDFLGKTKKLANFINELITLACAITLIIDDDKDAILNLSKINKNISGAHIQKDWTHVSHGFSGGEQKLFQMIWALCQKPKLLLFDETFTGLDSESAREARTYIHEKLQNTRIGEVFHFSEGFNLKSVYNYIIDIAHHSATAQKEAEATLTRRASSRAFNSPTPRQKTPPSYSIFNLVDSVENDITTPILSPVKISTRHTAFNPNSATSSFTQLIPKRRNSLSDLDEMKKKQSSMFWMTKIQSQKAESPSISTGQAI